MMTKMLPMRATTTPDRTELSMLTPCVFDELKRIVRMVDSNTGARNDEKFVPQMT
jgi:hypothetical protein